MSSFIFGDKPKTFSEFADLIFNRKSFKSVQVSDEALKRVQKSNEALNNYLNSGSPLYGVTTGFGDSCHRYVSPEQAEELQKNLVSYLLVGTGGYLPREAARATLYIRLNSLVRGLSGVSTVLIRRMQLLVENDWIPRIPKQGSLGASGDLVPLAYIAQVIQGEGEIETRESVYQTKELYEKSGITGYRLKAKEGLALVNGASAMAGLALVNIQLIKDLLERSIASSSWLCLGLRGRHEAFSTLVNERAKSSAGQTKVAALIREYLREENYKADSIEKIEVDNGELKNLIQDRYSLRCVPQILGPICETLEQAKSWLVDEINGVSDNPLVDEEGQMAMGGNFYGGYLCHSMDYLKICLAHMADLMDRQLTLLIDEKSNRGLPPNLANWKGHSGDEAFLHHGLKGIHQAVSAITSEVMAKAIPNGIFSRSSESHNQDKVSLGMTAATQCYDMIGSLYTIQTMVLTCFAQSLDLRGITLRGNESKKLYNKLRNTIPFVERDKPLDKVVTNLAEQFKSEAYMRDFNA